MKDIRFKEKFSVSLYKFSGSGIHGFTMLGDPDQPDHYTIGLNRDDTEIRNLAAFLHEMTHIYFHDLDHTDGNVQEIERRTQDSLLQAIQCLQEEYEDIHTFEV